MCFCLTVLDVIRMYDFDFLSVFLHCSVCVWLMCGFAFTVCQCQYWHVMLHGNVRHFT